MDRGQSFPGQNRRIRTGQIGGVQSGDQSADIFIDAATPGGFLSIGLEASLGLGIDVGLHRHDLSLKETSSDPQEEDEEP